MNLIKRSLILLAVLIPGYSSTISYNAKPLCDLATDINDNNSISFAYKIFDKKDCAKYLDNNLIKKGYQPIQITLANNTGNRFKFSRKNFNISTVCVDEIVPQCHKSIVSSVVGFSIGAIFI